MHSGLINFNLFFATSTFLPKSFILITIVCLNYLFQCYHHQLMLVPIPELTKYWLNGQPIPPTPTILIFNFDNISLFMKNL